MSCDLWQGDCLDLMKNIPDSSVDMVLCDLPYGTTQCKWDSEIDLVALWDAYDRITKPNAAILLFAQAPFSAKLMMSNIKNFRYEWVWIKNRATGFLNSKKMPLKRYENILCFYKKLPTFNPQMRTHDFDGTKFVGHNPWNNKYRNTYEGYGGYVRKSVEILGDERYPINLIKFDLSNYERGLHPTQKPVALCEYLIKSYTNENDLVLDNCMGSGSTGVACKRTNRRFIGIEMESRYFEIAKERLMNLS